jgi:hypothetical protein
MISTANANIIPTLDSVTGAGPYVWNYEVDVTVDQNVTTGDFFTIYDFAGATTGSAPAGWTMSVQNVGITPPLVLPGDNPAIPNVTFTYSGADIVGAADLGIFSINSLDNQMVEGFFAGLGTRNTGPLAGTTISNVGRVEVPTVVPEPATMTLIGMGGIIAMAGAAIKKRRRQQV